MAEGYSLREGTRLYQGVSAKDYSGLVESDRGVSLSEGDGARLNVRERRFVRL